MTYGFKFLNDNGETVVDDTNVKPWFYAQAPAAYVTDITNYTDYAQFNELNKTDGNGVEIDCDGVVGKKYEYEGGGTLPNQDKLFHLII